MKEKGFNRDKEDDPSGWGDEAYFCESCGKPFRYPLFDVAKEFERTIFQGDDSPPEIEIIGSEGIGNYCSNVCRDQARNSLLQRENVRATYPGIGPVERCSRCAAPVDMAKFHLAYVESVLDGEWDRMAVSVLDTAVVAIVCNRCSAPPGRLIAETDFPVDDLTKVSIADPLSK